MSPVRSVSQPKTVRAAAECPSSRAARNSSIAIEADCSAPAAWSPNSERACCSSASPSARSPRSNTAAPWTACRTNRNGGSRRGPGPGLRRRGARRRRRPASARCRPVSPSRLRTTPSSPSRGRPRRRGPRTMARIVRRRPRCRRRHPAGRGTASSGSRSRAGGSAPARRRARRARRPGRRARAGPGPGSGGRAPPAPVPPAARSASGTADRESGSAPNCSATARSTARSAGPSGGQDWRAWRRSPRAAASSPASRWVSAEARASQGSVAVACAPAPASARRSGPWSPARISGTAKRCSSSVSSAGSWLRLACSRASDRLVLARPPARGHPVQVGRPPQALPLEIGQQVRPQQLLDAVRVAVASGGRHERGLVLELVEQARRVLPPDSSAASPVGTGSLMLITRRNSWTSSGSPVRISPTR